MNNAIFKISLWSLGILFLILCFMLKPELPNNEQSPMTVILLTVAGFFLILSVITGTIKLIKAMISWSSGGGRPEEF